MNLISAILLGVIQGFTEFLPVSSSGHLVIAQSLIPNFEQPGVLFDVVLHAATAAAIVFHFRSNILKLSFNYISLIAIATLPAAAVGFLFKGILESFFSSLTIVGFALLLTAVLNFFTDRFWAKREFISRLDAIFIGLAQALAIIPGISRSGSTIFAGTSLGVDREKTAEFSFLLSVPAILGASLLELFTSRANNTISLTQYLFGFLSALAVALIALKLVTSFLVSRQFKYFSVYCAIVGTVAIVLGLT